MNLSLTCGKVIPAGSLTTSATLVYDNCLWLVATVTSLLLRVPWMRCRLWVAVATLGWRVGIGWWGRVAWLST